MNPLYKLDDTQHQATHPELLIWVNANAGTGKTTVLTSRVLKLLLAGTRPSKILCLTYTKAAASEMQNRIIDRLRFWVTQSDEVLSKEISTLIDSKPSESLMRRARGLFIEVLESAEGLNVQTIHSFAQSLLRRFPIEAGVSPYFRIMDEQEAANISNKSLALMLQQLHRGNLPHVEAAATWLIQETSEDSLKQILQKALQDVMKWKSVIDHPAGIAKFEEELAALLDLPTKITEQAHINAFITENTETNKQHLKSAVSYFAQNNHTQQYLQKIKEALLLRLNGTLEQPANLEFYISAFLTKTNSPIKALAKFSDNEEVAAFLRLEQEKALQFVQRRAAIRAMQKTLSYYVLIDAMFKYYRQITDRLGVLDYQQLLIKAEQLLTSASNLSGWVMYKMDGGLEHILVDEAQDTSPEQWHIIRAITDEFFSGESQSKATRTLFVVGDEKQSIFSFQGADVSEFRKMKSWFQARAEDSARKLEVIALEKSYRSANKIIEAVNAVAAAQGFSGIHLPKDNSSLGKVVILPAITKATDVENVSENNADASDYSGANGNDGDSDGDNDQASEKVQVLLAKKLAITIKNWLAQGKYIESVKRAIRPEDIMVLVKRRSILVQTLTNELKRYGITVQGTDRITLGRYIAVQDMIALGRWLTLPEDDYALACILRSPIGGISEEDLFELAYEREYTLWAALQKKLEEPRFAPIATLLKTYLNKVDLIDPYQLFYQLLIKDKKMQVIISRLGGEAGGILIEFLNQAIEFQAKQPASMQGFIQYMEENATEIKRNNALPDAVRIMTVHGAKGLEAPVVILADTADSKSPHDSISWLPTSVGNMPFCMPKKELRSELLQQFSTATNAKHMAEYQRLLYVAITRAKDELYITGYRNSTKVDENSWYALLENTLADIAEFTDFDALATSSPSAPLVVSAPPFIENSEQGSVVPIPHFMLQPLAPPASKPKLLKASDLVEFKSEASQLTADNQNFSAKDFGILLHQCIEAIFAISEGDVGLQAIQSVVKSLPDSITNEVRSKLTAQLTGLIENPDTAFLFKAATRLVESPMTGVVSINGKPERISAVIDLCVISDASTWLIDFKTSDHVPISAEQTSKTYVRQLALYQHFLASVLQNKNIRTALVWTKNATFQEVPNALLEAELLDLSQDAT